MDRFCFERLVVAVGRHLEAMNRIIRLPRTPLSKAVMMTLWILANPDTFRTVGVLFGVSPGTVHFHYKYIIQALREMSSDFISWPTPCEREEIAQNFEDAYGYPGVVGCIDGTQIRITGPLEQPARYVDRHHDHSIILQAVCDDSMLFRDVHLGQPGCVGDARTFERSPLGEAMLRDNSLVGERHLLGDGAYTCTDKMMTPYRNYGNLTRRQRTHNYHLSRCRATIERAFALLKGKWRRLKFFPHYCLEYALDAMMACVMLHNFILLDGIPYERNRHPPPDDFPFLDVADRNILLDDARELGHEKREFIADLLTREE